MPVSFETNIGRRLIVKKQGDEWSIGIKLRGEESASA